MSEYDLLKAFSDLDEKHVMQPRRFVSTRLNLLFCVLSAIISGSTSHTRPVLSLFIYFLSFALLYLFTTLFINRKSQRKLLNEPRHSTHSSCHCS